MDERIIPDDTSPEMRELIELLGRAKVLIDSEFMNRTSNPQKIYSSDLVRVNMIRTGIDSAINNAFELLE